MSFGRPPSNSRGRARYSLVVITLCGVSALGKSLGWSTTMTQPVMARSFLIQMSHDRCQISDLCHLSFRQLLLEPERMTAVLVVVLVPAEFMIPGPAINLHGTVISFVNFKPQGSACAPPRDLLCHREQGRRNPAACVFRGDCEGIESRDPAGS